MEPGMSSSDISVISKQMELMSMTDRVIRSSKRLASPRYSPYTLGTNEKEKQKEEAVRLGVELSLFLADAMFILSNNIRSPLWFGHWLCKDLGNHIGPVVQRLFIVFLNMFIKNIKPKFGGVYDQPGGDSIQCELITSSSQHFTMAVEGLSGVVSTLRNGGILKSCSFEKCNQELKTLEESLRLAMQASGGNGVAREITKSKVLLPMWKSLFEVKPNRINPQGNVTMALLYHTMTRFRKMHPEPSSMTSYDISIISKCMESLLMTSRVLSHNNGFPVSTFSLYNSWNKKQKEEAVRVGVEFSLFMAEAMFILSDDIRCMLMFCLWILSHPRKCAGKQGWDDPLVERLFCVIEYVFETYIKPKNGVYHESHNLIQQKLLETFRQIFGDGVIGLTRIVSVLKMSETSSMNQSDFENYNQELKKLKDMLRSVKGDSDANGFAREEIESKILHLWKPLFENEKTPQIKKRIEELFSPLFDELKHFAFCRDLASLCI